MTTAKKLVSISRRLSRKAKSCVFSKPVEYVYNPLSYAKIPHEEYLRAWGNTGIECLLLGMNPGPWGMAQTGVPFGEVAAVRDFLRISGNVVSPQLVHPKRPIEGFECTRSEVSGRRLWEWVENRFKHPEAFFNRFFVWNDCPLAFLEESGRNRTPDKLPVEEFMPLAQACDEATRAIVKLLGPRMVIGIGGHAEKRLRSIFKSEISSGDLECGRILHPSPASPAANKGWASQAESQFKALGISIPNT